MIIRDYYTELDKLSRHAALNQLLICANAQIILRYENSNCKINIEIVD